MRRNLLTAALILMTIWATGCVIIDTGRLESRGPRSVRSESIEIRQGGIPGTPATDVSMDESLNPAGQ